MDIKEKKTVDMLTKDSVSILTQKFIELDGVNTQVGSNHRCSYSNSVYGRSELTKNEPTDVVNAVLAIWGDVTTITEDSIENVFEDSTENAVENTIEEK